MRGEALRCSRYRGLEACLLNKRRRKLHDSIIARRFQRVQDLIGLNVAGARREQHCRRLYVNHEDEPNQISV